MKLTTNTDRTESTPPRSIASVCRACGQKILRQIRQVKLAILAESATKLATQRHALRLALNEAEALAWETMHPQLFFPALAAEKVQAVAAWDARQRALRRQHPQSLAA